MTRAAYTECLLPLPATQEWGGLETLHKNDHDRFKAPLSLALSPLRRERVFAVPCSLSYGLLRTGHPSLKFSTGRAVFLG